MQRRRICCGSELGSSQRARAPKLSGSGSVSLCDKVGARPPQRVAPLLEVARLTEPLRWLSELELGGEQNKLSVWGRAARNSLRAASVRKKSRRGLARTAAVGRRTADEAISAALKARRKEGGRCKELQRNFFGGKHYNLITLKRAFLFLK